MADLHTLTVAQAAALIRERTLSPVALAETLLQRIDALEPTLHAWVTIDREEVLGTARELERELEQRGPRGPLHGIPVGLKDIIYTAGMKTTAGSPLYTDFVPTYDATCVMRLKKAGAMVLGKTVTTEFANGDPTPARNPWNLAHTPGGSSSGSAVAVGARMCPATLGSQTGGSTLRPAIYNGVVGFKPSYGRTSRYGVVPCSWTLDHVGILVRTVEDAALILQAIAGYDPNDPSTVPEAVPDYLAHLESQKEPPRIGVVRGDFYAYADREVCEHTDQVVGRLRQAGATILEVSLPSSLDLMLALQAIIMNTETAAFQEETFRANPDAYGPVIRTRIETGLLYSGAEFLRAQRARRRIRQEMQELAGQVDVLLTPATPAPPPRDLTTTGDHAFQAPWTLAGLPAIALPSGLSREGLPLGIQLIGPLFEEERLLAVARWCERALSVILAPPETPVQV